MRLVIPAARIEDRYIIVPHVARAPLFLLVELEDDGYRILDVVDNPYLSVAEGRGEKVASLIASLRPEAVLVRGIGPGMRARLEGMGIEVYEALSERLEEALQGFRQS